jgi:hypothetical protein
MALYDVVPVPPQDGGKADAVRLLRDRFPEFSQSFGDPDNADPETAEPYYSYSRLVEWVLAKKDDKALLQKVSSFINELILSKDNLLEELAIIEVLRGWRKLLI